MPLTTAALLELKHELALLRRTRGDLAARIRTLERLLRFERAPASSSIRPTSSEARPGTKRPSGGRSRATFQSQVAAVVTAANGLSPKQVVERLQRNGIFVSGRTSMYDRVYRELRRLAEKGVVRRNGKAFVAFRGSDGQEAHEPALSDL